MHYTKPEEARLQCCDARHAHTQPARGDAIQAMRRAGQRAGRRTSASEGFVSRTSLMATGCPTHIPRKTSAAEPRTAAPAAPMVTNARASEVHGHA